uniref:Uncharacterized protein n=1 Tax=Picea glauca TaxID=3330 RepID=A0A117NHT0_PICGL|nr:hypothetical protein ABT39_MTgene4198 [Picea glauca]
MFNRIKMEPPFLPNAKNERAQFTSIISSLSQPNCSQAQPNNSPRNTPGNLPASPARTLPTCCLPSGKPNRVISWLLSTQRAAIYR